MLAPPEAQQHFDPPIGWLDLGSWQDASHELERLAPELHTAPEVLLLRCRVYAHAGRWSAVEMIAEGAARAYPENQRFYTHWAWALHRQGHTAEALATVSSVAARFQRAGQLPTLWHACTARCWDRCRRRMGGSHSPLSAPPTPTR
jgi:hypothetical protein